MHPAKSVIFFTTASGAGYGLMVWLGLLAFRGLIPFERAFGLTAIGLAFALIVGGLVSSTLHLGHPERAWRAMSQWRSSWLSREGLAALLGFIPQGLFALAWLFAPHYAPALGLASAAMALLTVWCTAMIYASLRAVPAWHNGWTVAGYLVLALATGALLAAPLAAFWYYAIAHYLGLAAIALLGAGLVVKLAYWRSIGRGSGSDAGGATGLGRFGEVTLIEGPHTQANYLLKEMGFAIARKHARRLRLVAVLAGFLIPMAVTALALRAEGDMQVATLGLACIVCAIGIATERWLFFSEARHVVTLYYGAQRA